MDSEIVLTDAERMGLFYRLEDYDINSHKPKPVGRVLIPKKHGRSRPLVYSNNYRDCVFSNAC